MIKKENVLTHSFSNRKKMCLVVLCNTLSPTCTLSDTSSNPFFVTKATLLPAMKFGMAWLEEHLYVLRVL